MATLTLKGLARLVQDQAAAVQAKSAAILDFSAGSVLRAFVESNAAVGVWLQALVLKVLAASRLSTAAGSDVDTFIQDFGLTRLAASSSSGLVSFSRYTATNASVIPLGAGVQTSDGTQSFKVVADLTNAAYSAASNGYLLGAGTTSVNVTVQSTGTGPATNVSPGTITILTTSISGVDLVTNALALAGGTAGETDAAVRARFVLFILGLSRGDVYGVSSALSNMNVGITYTITDQYQYNGTFLSGYFYVVVDDGSGVPSAAFLNSARTAVNAVKPLGNWFGVFAPVLVYANVSMTLTVATGYTRANVVAAVGTAVYANITTLGLGAGLPYSQLSAWAYAIPGVTNVTSIILNGAALDIAANNQNRIFPGTIAVS
jgi:uncharacterized phage protein gp47/JayE